MSIILELKRVRIDELTPYEGNARRGDVAGLRGSLAELDQYRPLVVNVGTHTGRPMEILAGNHTWQAAREAEWTEIDITTVDVDQRTAAKINVADNRWSDKASYDTDLLIEQLSELDEDYTGTGWTEEEVHRLLTPPIIEEPDAGAGLGDLEWKVIVDCHSEADQAEMLRTLELEGRTARPWVA